MTGRRSRPSHDIWHCSIRWPHDIVVGVSKRVLSFIALIITVFYAIGFAVWDVSDTYTIIGAVTVLLAWIGVGMLSKQQLKPPPNS